MTSRRDRYGATPPRRRFTWFPQGRLLRLQGRRLVRLLHRAIRHESGHLRSLVHGRSDEEIGTPGASQSAGSRSAGATSLGLLNQRVSMFPGRSARDGLRRGIIPQNPKAIPAVASGSCRRYRCGSLDLDSRRINGHVQRSAAGAIWAAGAESAEPMEVTSGSSERPPSGAAGGWDSPVPRRRNHRHDRYLNFWNSHFAQRRHVCVTDNSLWHRCVVLSQ